MMVSIGFGSNAQYTYGEVDHKPIFYEILERENPQALRWCDFRNPSKVRKDQSVIIVDAFLKYHGLDPMKYYRGGTFPANIVHPNVEAAVVGAEREGEVLQAEQDAAAAVEDGQPELGDLGDQNDENLNNTIQTESVHSDIDMDLFHEEEGERELNLQLDESSEFEFSNLTGNGIISDSSEEGRRIAQKKRKRHEDENVVSKLQKKSHDFIE